MRSLDEWTHCIAPDWSPAKKSLKPIQGQQVKKCCPRGKLRWIYSLCHFYTQFEEGIGAIPDSKVVNSCENLNAMREGPLTTNVLLEGSRSCPPTGNLWEDDAHKCKSRKESSNIQHPYSLINLLIDLPFLCVCVCSTIDLTNWLKNQLHPILNIPD